MFSLAELNSTVKGKRQCIWDELDTRPAKKLNSDFEVVPPELSNTDSVFESFEQSMNYYSENCDVGGIYSCLRYIWVFSVIRNLTFRFGQKESSGTFQMLNTSEERIISSSPEISEFDDGDFPADSFSADCGNSSNVHLFEEQNAGPVSSEIQPKTVIDLTFESDDDEVGSAQGNHVKNVGFSCHTCGHWNQVSVTLNEDGKFEAIADSSKGVEQQQPENVAPRLADEQVKSINIVESSGYCSSLEATASEYEDLTTEYSAISDIEVEEANDWSSTLSSCSSVHSQTEDEPRYDNARSRSSETGIFLPFIHSVGNIFGEITAIFSG
ncbi:hypothetical protein BKA69DRAFT_1044302 [Paraphysoderma sedebokerense]|nr:hypothetical protein BKA69DRAFT_1044302 [Paraphysoderma sedebokerense]